MNKRRRHKLKRRRRLVKRTMAILHVNYRNAKSFLAAQLPLKRAAMGQRSSPNVYRAYRQLERMLWNVNTLRYENPASTIFVDRS